MTVATRRLPPAATYEPVAELNITPLIDVLLVLLVMMILTMPRSTHMVPIDLPSPSTDPQPRTESVHKVTIAADGTIAYDGAPVDQAGLRARLIGIAGDPLASVQLAAEATSRYLVFDRTLATIKRAGITRLGFVGNERFAAFDAGTPSPDGTR